MKNLSLALIALAAFSFLTSCSFITLWTPLSDTNKLGTVLDSGGKITIQNTNGTVTVEYVAPTKRTIIWNGQSREIDLRKSSMINGLYTKEGLKFKGGPIGDISGVFYQESTAIISSDEQYQNLLKYECPSRSDGSIVQIQICL